MASASSSNPLLYACIAHHTTILAEHTTSTTTSAKTASAATLASVLLPKITHAEPQKQIYTHNNHYIYYISDADNVSQQQQQDNAPSGPGLAYLIIASQDQGKRLPFALLLELKSKFLAAYPPSTTTFSSLPPYGAAAFNSTLKSLLATYATSLQSGTQSEDAFTATRAELDQVRGVMVQNIERVLERGERMDLLVDKTDRLGGSARDFRVRSRGLRRQMWWKNVRLMVLLGVVGVFLVYLLVGMGCGLPGWGRCIGRG